MIIYKRYEDDYVFHIEEGTESLAEYMDYTTIVDGIRYAFPQGKIHVFYIEDASVPEDATVGGVPGGPIDGEGNPTYVDYLYRDGSFILK